ncbi:MAG: hypothetical protein NZM12_12970, partial [Steroidobacteraceae bacterium]|nr:hypothetical protein [Steroidobacteraceae bacterium]
MAAFADSVGLRPYYRRFELPWTPEPEQDEKFRRLWRVLLLGGTILGIIIWLLPVPELSGPLTTSVPPRLAKVL